MSANSNLLGAVYPGTELSLMMMMVMMMMMMMMMMMVMIMMFDHDNLDDEYDECQSKPWCCIIYNVYPGTELSLNK